MCLPLPKFQEPPEIYEAIIREHRSNGMRMGEILMACGWTIGDAAKAVVTWDLRTLAAALAHERAKRNVRLTMLTEVEVAQLRKQIQSEKKSTVALRPKKTTRVVRTPHVGLRPPCKPEGPPT